MPHKHLDGNWQSCTLCRSLRQSRGVLEKAARRKVEWPERKEYERSPVEDPLVYTTIDDAFATILEYMTVTSRQCKRFYKSCGCSNRFDKTHCNRFHTPEYTDTQRRNPIGVAEDVHVVVPPGSYAVTAGQWGTRQQQTHVVHIQPGQTANLDFVM
ncbi:hypothetical protein LSAT2_001744 [Lamellibrachia satsuma]|nr:hypothetical protein LSAT2_001744 [Lamellibrachia satsuma]